MAIGVAVAGLVVAAAGAGSAYSQGEASRKGALQAKKKQEALVAKQDKLIAEEQAKQDKVALERSERLKKNQLLTGAETGIASGATNSLLTKPIKGSLLT